MKHLNFLFILLLSSYLGLGQVVINEFSYETDQIELKNTGDTPVNIAGYQLCSFPEYNSISSLTGMTGEIMLMPGNLMVVTGHFENVNTPEDDELGLYINSSFSSSASIIDYVEWGSTGHQRSSMAVMANIWSTGDFLMAPMAGMSVAWDGESDETSSWSAGEPTFGSENNAGDCLADGGTITTVDNTTICAGDGEADPITVTFTDVVGTNSLFVITDEELNILNTQEGTTFDFDGAGPGVCLIWHLSYEDDVDLNITNAQNLSGCFNLSNSIAVTRNQPDGGIIATEDNTTICAGDGEADPINVTFTEVMGTNSIFVITDEELNILDTQTGTTFDFDGAGPGVCLIWHLSYEDDVDLNITNAENLSGCFDLSNSIAVTRNQPDGGIIATEDNTTICAGDGTDDIINVTFSEVAGTNSIFVITDEELNILGAQTETEFNFDGAGSGVCLIWHLSYEDDVDLDITNAGDLSGCFDLSNSIAVTRNQPEGGAIATEDSTSVCTDDNEDDIITVTFSDVVGTNSIFVVTDEELNIIDTQTEPEFNFEGAESGICLIWHLSYEDDVVLEGVTNAGDLTGCFSLSNAISVDRRTGEECDCLANGGTISTMDNTTACVGDDEEDEITVDFTGVSGTNSLFVITDENLEILDTQTENVIDFDESPAGVCLIWHLSYEDDVDLNITNAADLSGCFSLSNSIEVTRLDAPEGGEISTEDETEICTADGMEDLVTVTLEESSGTNSIYVITDEDLNILLTQESNIFDFEGGDQGTCLIWHLSYEDNVDLNVSNAADLTGCFSLSNEIEIERTAPVGGVISTEDATTLCLSDEGPHTIDVDFTDVVGDNSLFVVTDEDLNIISTQTDTIFDFSNAGIGVCLIWHLSYEDDVDLDVTNAGDLTGCFSLSNPIEITRYQPNGGMISTENVTTICADDGEADVITVDFSDIAGTNSVFVITDESLNILNTSTSNEIDFEGSGEGTCLIWHLSYEDDVDLAISNASELSGCFSLSNPLEITRRVGEACDCLANGGTISTEDPTTICAGNGEDDIVNIDFLWVNGTNSLFVVTDSDLNITSTQTETEFNFEDSSLGTCLIWHLSYEDDVDLTGITNAAELSGCFDLSNPIEITKNEPRGGTISTSDVTTFCVNDGQPDVVSVSVTDTLGTNNIFVITDENLDIVGVQEGSEFEFDGAGQGVCLIWHLSYEDNVDLTEITNAGDLEGCFSLSNSIEINRILAEGATVSVLGGSDNATVIADDGIPNEITFDNTSTSIQDYTYFITNTEDIVVGIAGEDEDFTYDFEGGTAGNCRVYGYSYSGTLEGDTLGANLSSITSDACSSLSSNFVTVIKALSDNIGEINGMTVKVFPTSITNELNIQGLDQAYDLVIHNATGQIVYNEYVADSRSLINLPSFASGMYIGRIIIGSEALNFRLIKE